MSTTDGMQSLWVAVLGRAVLDARGDALMGEEPEFARDSVATWVGTPDFSAVCEMAGVDPVAAEIAMTRELTIGC